MTDLVLPINASRRRLLGAASASALVALSGGASALLASDAVAAAEKANPYRLQRACVVYFSRTGHTRRVAEAVQAVTGAVPYEVKLVKTYSEDYRTATHEVLAEIERGVRPAIEPISVPMDDYDVFFIGSPTWWHHVSTPMQQWLLSVSLNGKTVMPFTTHGGGFEAETRKDWLSYGIGADVKPSLVIFGRNWGSFESDVRSWMEEAGLV